ncbi:MAG: N-acetylmuramoyl-L-alanine amidase [Oscillatoriales cyanobacterium RM2_1_1]|nr:N-acetylmuramoyl-L-alanine amidase [Oscillatoriales cyanobacterium SM2_3_0]NJO44607.1 N-acetylmuramoyl-L-alanine amidase [Oscillatoriales cyanobacterium RM2_1_1]
MNLKLTTLVLLALSLITLILTIGLDSSKSTNPIDIQGFSSLSPEPIEVVEPALADQNIANQDSIANQDVVTSESANPELGFPASCGVRPEPQKAGNPDLGPEVESPASLYRFRRPVSWQNSVDIPRTPDTPNEYQAIADRTNYGQRYLYDLSGKPTNNYPIIVIHETAASAESTIRFFQTYHTSEDDQASYHTLITRAGDIVYTVPPDLRAFGAGNSVFASAAGPEAVKTDPKYPASVNNFAYHVSLESPPDGYKNGPSHSGYTPDQYRSLAWIISRTGVPEDRITTHKAVDRSGQRSDPRSFDQQMFLSLLRSYPSTQEITIGCRSPYQS